MREIKFRAYNKHTNKMYEVEGISFRHNNIIVTSDITSERQQKLGDFELMQYTGLKDKNGKELYEGDIAQGYFNRGMQFREGAVKLSIGRFIVHGLTGVPLYEFLEGNNMNLEIIGNIYENPELLNK